MILKPTIDFCRFCCAYVENMLSLCYYFVTQTTSGNMSNKNNNTLYMAKQEIKEPVKLRQKTLANGNVSLYLDIYHNGRRTYEFLKLYIIPEKTRADKEKNRETLKLANSVKAQRIIEIQNGEFGFKTSFAGQTLFFNTTAT